MQILSLELYRYHRFSASNIERIRITPQNKVHLILGTNGSGKSALIREMSPLPANHKDYTKGGYKKIKIQKGSSIYHLSSDFSVEPYAYSFIKDDVELNPGHKLTDFRKLVAQEFNITADVHELNTGRIRFTQMGPSECRQWLTRFSDADYTYALQYFKRLTEAYRDMTGARKLQQARLVQEKGKLITPEVEEVLRKEVDVLTSLVEEILGMRGEPTDVKGSVSDYLSAIDQELDRTTQSFRSIYRYFGKKTRIYTDEELEEAIIKATGELHSYQRSVSSMCEEIDKHQKTLDQFMASGVEPTKNVDTTIQEYRAEIGEKKSILLMNLPFEDPSLALQTLNTVSETFVSLFNGLPPDPESKINRGSYEAKTTHHLAVTESIKVYEAKHDHLVLRLKGLEHLKTHNQVECPQCKHQWVKGFSEAVYQDIQEQIKVVTDKIEEAKATLQKLQTSIEEESNYLSTMTAIAQLFRSWPILSPFWNHLASSGYIRTSPPKALQIFNDLAWELKEMVAIKDLQEKLDKALELKEMMVKDHMSSVQTLIDTNDQKQQELSKLQLEVHNRRAHLDSLQAYKATSKNIKDISSKLERLLGDRDARISSAMKELNRMVYTEIIQNIQMEISDRRHTISRVDIQKALIRDIEGQITEMDRSIEVLKIAIKELSPNEGLIAKGLTGFINHFVHQMNAFIRKVWLHPLEVMPIEYDAEKGVDLDYKFSMKVGDSGVVVPDISEGSEAQKKMVDFAFTVIAAKYLGLDNAQLFLDEFAASMDHAHRASAFALITTLANTSNFSQIFVISHFENSYSSLVNADVTVMCPHNIILPKNLVYNQHALIE